jgi:hypothetical protein
VCAANPPKGHFVALLIWPQTNFHWFVRLRSYLVIRVRSFVRRHAPLAVCCACPAKLERISCAVG